MTAEEAREELEAAIKLYVASKRVGDSFLAAADRYARAFAAEFTGAVLDGIARDARTGDRRQALAEATGGTA
jgi:hypothetical protein